MPQAQDIRTFGKGMNKDVDPRLLQAGEYIHAENVMNSNYIDSSNGIITNYKGVFDHEVGVGSSIVVGLFKDDQNNCLYYFIAGVAESDRISKFDLETNNVTTIVSNSFLNLDVSREIKSCVVIEGIILWTDGYGEIGMYDTNISYGTIQSNMLTLAQVKPLTKPDIASKSVPNYKANNITGKFFQFKYRFVFKNKMRSAFSPISDVSFSSDDYYSPAQLSGIENPKNSVDVTMSGANSNNLVAEIEVAARSGNNGDFFLVAKIDADATFLSGGDQTYSFFNQGLYEPIALQESNQLFDDVPRTAGTLSVANNRVVPGNVKNGYDDVDVDYDIEVVYQDTASPESRYEQTDRLTDTGSAAAFISFMSTEFGYTTPIPGDKVWAIGLYVDGTQGINHYGDVTYIVQDNDTVTDIYNYLFSSDRKFWNQAIGVEMDGLLDVDISNIPPDTIATRNEAFGIGLEQGAHSKTFKSGAWYSVGLQYEDEYGRTNGVQLKDDPKVYIKTLGERGLTAGDYSEAGAAQIKVTINNADPSWAEKVKVVYSRASVYDQSLQLATRGALAEAGSQVNVSIDIGSIVEWNDEKGGNIAYQWEKGDRIRILTGNNNAPYGVGESILNDWSQSLIEAEIVNADSSGGTTTSGYAIVIPKLDGLSQAETVTLLSTGAIIEIFRPSKELESAQAIYTESDNVSSGVVTITGDAYFKSREDYPYGTGSDTQNIAFEGYDISDFIESEHYDKGRPTAVINQQEAQRFATLFYSEAFIPNTEVNQLNRFYPDVNFEEYNKTFGNIIHLHNEGDHLLMLQEDKVSKVYIDRALTYDAAGGATVLNTQQKVLSEAVPYSGVYGIHDHKSFQAIGNRRYWLDAARGVAVRLSNNGIEEVSRYGMRGWFSEECKGLLDLGDKNVHGVFDVQNDSYIISFDDQDDVLHFDEKNNAWVTFITFFKPRYSVYINNRTFFIDSNGSGQDSLFEMNVSGIEKNSKTDDSGVIGSASESIIQFPSNTEPAMLKNYLGIHINGSHPLDVGITTEAIGGGSDQDSSLDSTIDFRQREQEWHASFLRDSNTPNVSNPLLEGDTIKGFHAIIELSLPALVAEEEMKLRYANIVVSKG